MTPPKEIRCAVYTRKSTEHNLDLEFNSLDAQREACESYIKSQIHEGWRLISDHYDDGGISGASLDRASLQLLLSDIKAGKIDTVVVYKVDRLTRSLTDFAKLVELFDAHGVSFVSVTQAFNTTNSMGRLTLNVLLSFAQFEREVIGERVRDKVGASKRKGLYMGGLPPLGYINRSKKLEIVPSEAETVRFIFHLFIELGSVGLVLKELNDRRITTKLRTYGNGRSSGGGPFWKGALFYLLRNRSYVGEIFHKGEIYPAEHLPIIERDLFEQVQSKLTVNAATRKLKLKASPFLLTGLIYDSAGNAMSPTHTSKRGVRYRYYVSQGVLQRRTKSNNGEVNRIPAPDIEELVIGALKEHNFICSEGQIADRRSVEGILKAVVIQSDRVELRLNVKNQPEDVVVIPFCRKATKAIKGVVGEVAQPADYRSCQKLLKAIAKARDWVEKMVEGEMLSAIAERESRTPRQIRLLLPLAFISPGTVEDIIAGGHPEITASKLCRNVPLVWRGNRQPFPQIQPAR